MRKVMYVRDPVHGSIKLSPLQEDLLKTVEVQRLSFIHQLGTTFQCYPGAHGMRLAHAVGVSHLAGVIAEHLAEQGIPGNTEEDGRVTDLVQAAGMLHDIGHTPWSHTLEPLYAELHGMDHMGLVAEMVTGRTTMSIPGSGRIPEILRDWRVEPSMVAELVRSRFHGAPYIQQIIFGEVDADMLDYLQRDFHFTGVAFGHIEVDRIISTMTVRERSLVFQMKGLDAVRDFLLARFHMYSSVYLHRKTRIVDQMLLAAARRSVLELGEMADFHFMTDDQLLSWLAEQSGDPWVREMAWRVKYRQGLFTQVFGIGSLTRSSRNAGFLAELLSHGGSPGESADFLAARISAESGVDRRYIIVDLPVEAVKMSEERFGRLDIRFVDSSGRVFTLDDVDPAFSRYLGEMKPNRNTITVSSAPEHRERVASACGKLFREAVIPLFSEEDQESSPSR
jgi:HD superfamily phosphohydrolase